MGRANAVLDGQVYGQAGSLIERGHECLVLHSACSPDETGRAAAAETPRLRTVAVPVPTDTEVLAILDSHCTMCHAEHPTHEGFDEPPADVALTTLQDLRRFADRVEAQAVRGDAMPLGNETHMTDEERDRLGAWIEANAQ